jgi:hypothetical protein
MQRSLALISLTLALTGCSIVAKTPMTRFESPEAIGEQWAPEAQLAYQGRNEVALTPNFSTRAPSLDNPSVETPGHRIVAIGALGLFERLDISASLPESRFGLKYQFLGNPFASAEKGNFSASGYGGIASLKEEEAQGGLYYQLRELQYDLGLVFGYRADHHVLLYSGPFMIWDKMKTNYRTTAGGATTSQEASSRAYGLNLGIQFNKDKAFLRLEGAGMKTRLGNAYTGRGTYGGSVGTYF